MGRSTRRRDRVVGSYPTTGAPEFDGANFQLPRSTYRDYEGVSGTFRPDATVYRPAPTARVARRLHITATPIPARHPAKRDSKARFLLPWKSFQSSELPHRILFCIRRKMRREVLFALGLSGFRGSAPKKHYRRNPSSNYRC